jgi:hypothetical protein
MLERGGFSFVALLVINPLLILFFQNCSFAPVLHSEVAAQSVRPTQQREISSVGMMDRAAPGHKKALEASAKNVSE